MFEGNMSSYCYSCLQIPGFKEAERAQYVKDTLTRQQPQETINRVGRGYLVRRHILDDNRKVYFPEFESDKMSIQSSMKNASTLVSIHPAQLVSTLNMVRAINKNVSEMLNRNTKSRWYRKAIHSDKGGVQNWNDFYYDFMHYYPEIKIDNAFTYPRI